MVKKPIWPRDAHAEFGAVFKRGENDLRASSVLMDTVATAAYD